jgi:YcaO-like protein with predicted kinase domain
MPLGDQPTDTVSAALLRRLTEAMRRHGMTRLADQTGLDRLGVPSMAATRPNAATVTTHQGKGETLEAAAFSALMEAAEYACAERPPAAVIHASCDHLAAKGARYLLPDAVLPAGEPLPRERGIGWMAGTDLVNGEDVFVPRDMVKLADAEDMPGLSQSTSGLAAGFDQDHARRHALCELIERDAMVLWGFRSDASAAATELNPYAFGDAGLAALCEKARDRNLDVGLFDITSDLAIPTIYAVMTDRQTDLKLGVSTGAACHPVAAVAARKALLEAAQTRVSLIAGVRDDIAEAEYERTFSTTPDLPGAATFRSPPQGLEIGHGPAAELRHVLKMLIEHGHDSIVAVAIGGAEMGIHVEKLFVPGLEDRLTNRHWRPGRRAVRAMLGQ